MTFLANKVNRYQQYTDTYPLLFHGVISILEYWNINPHAKHGLTQHEMGVYLSTKGAQRHGAGPRFVSHPVKLLTQKKNNMGPNAKG